MTSDADWTAELGRRDAILKADAEWILREFGPGGALRGAMLAMQEAQEWEDGWRDFPPDEAGL